MIEARLQQALRSKKTVLVVALVLVSLVATRFWFIDDYLITNVDLDYPLDPVSNWLDRIGVWYQTRGGGTTAGSVVLGAGMYFLPAISHVIGGYSYGQFLTFATMNLALSLGVVYFIVSVTGVYKTWARVSASFFVSIAATYSFYLAFTWVRLQTANFILLFTLILFGATTRYILGRSSLPRFLFVVALSSLATSWSLGSQPPLMTILAGLYLSYAAVLVYLGAVWRTRAIGKSLAGLVAGTVGIGITSIWWFLPWLLYVNDNNLFNSEVLNTTYEIRKLLATATVDMSVSNSWRGIGDFAWFAGYWPQIDPWLESPILVFLSFLLPVTAGYGLLKASRSPRRAASLVGFWFVAAAIGVLLSTGILGVTGAAYEWAVTNVPLFNLQRAPWQKFMILPWIGLILPLYFGLLGVMRSLNGRSVRTIQARSALALAAATIIVLPGTWLTVTGQMFSKGWGEEGWHETNGFGFHLDVPDYIFSASDSINSKYRDSDVLLLPESSVQAYDWGYGSSHDVTWLTLKTGVVAPNYGEGLLPPSAAAYQEAQKEAIDAIYSSPETAACALARIGVGVLLFRGDFRNEYLANNQYAEGMSAEEKGAIPRTYWSDLANSLPGFTYVEQHGPWLIYVAEPNIYELARKLRVVSEGDMSATECPSRSGLESEPRESIVQSPSGNVLAASLELSSTPRFALLNESEPYQWRALQLFGEASQLPAWLAADGRLAGLMYPVLDWSVRNNQGWLTSILAGGRLVSSVPQIEEGQWFVPATDVSSDLVVFHAREGALAASLLLTALLSLLFFSSLLFLSFKRRSHPQTSSSRRNESSS